MQNEDAGYKMNNMEGTASRNEYRELEDQFSTAVSQVGASVWVYDFQDKTLSIKGNGAARFGLTPVETNIPESFIERGFVHPDDIEKFRKLYARLHEGAKTATETIRWRSSDGSDYWWEKICYTTVFDKDERPYHAIGSFMDVSAEKSLEQKYQAEVAFQNSDVSPNLMVKVRSNITQDLVESYIAKRNVAVATEETPYTQAVERLAQTGLTIEQQQCIRTTLDRKRVLKDFAAGETHYAVEYQRKRRDGTAIWVNTIVNSYQNPETNDVMSFLYTYDINREKIMQTIVGRLVDLEHEFIAVVDVKTQRVFLFTQKTAGIAVHMEENDIYGDACERVISNLVVEEKLAECLPKFRLNAVVAALELNDTYVLSYPVRETDGSIGYRKWTYSYLDDTKTAIFYTRSDITALFVEQEMQQQALRSALLAAEQANAAKSDFLSRMSHEIRTPMNAIIGMSAIAAQSLGDDEQVADCISKIGISSRFLLSLINDILDMSRIESGKVLLKNEKIPFEEFICGVNSICYTQAHAKHIDYENIVDPGMEDYYIGDAMKLQQVIINIISNAVKFTQEGGRVVLSVRQIKKTKNDAVLRFTVNDTGCGISEEFLPHLFEPFAQEHIGATAMYGGTGLGLAICKNIVDMMDGRINVRSIVGIGSEFTVEVKLGITEENKRRYAKRPHHNFADLKALVVDDDVIICEHAVITLKEIGIKSEWVDSGRKAVSCVREKWERKEYYDLILVDWKMPDMDGIETARQIRRIVGPDVTIIIMTAYDWASIEHEAKAAGVNMLMNKPMFKSSLISAFEKVFYEKELKTAHTPNEDFDFTGKRVLLAEDHPLNTEVATRLLLHEGFLVETAENGLRAMELFANSPVGYYDAILMDIRMPQMDGLQAAYNIRHWHKDDAKTIPIIAMTANAFEDDIEKSKAAGMNAHLAKPIEPKLLFETLYKFIYADQDRDS